MPTLITRAEALTRIQADAGAPACLMCAICQREAGPVHVIHEDEQQLVMLPSYVRRWGHVMVMPKPHVTDYQSVDPQLWSRSSALAHRAARMVERIQQPRRCYMASLGSSGGELTQTSRHLHIHVIPIYDTDDRPSSVFSWSEGVYVGTEQEWAQLLATYQRGWQASAP